MAAYWSAKSAKNGTGAAAGAGLQDRAKQLAYQGRIPGLDEKDQDDPYKATQFKKKMNFDNIINDSRPVSDSAKGDLDDRDQTNGGGKVYVAEHDQGKRSSHVAPSDKPGGPKTHKLTPIAGDQANDQVTQPARDLGSVPDGPRRSRIGYDTVEDEEESREDIDESLEYDDDDALVADELDEPPLKHMLESYVASKTFTKQQN